MSMSKESVQQQLNLDKCPEQFKKPFAYALESKKLLLLSLEITDREVSNDIVPFLKANPTITFLNVQDNEITWKGALALSKVETLLTLHIGSNEIGDLGAEFIAESKTLTTVDAWDNDIGDKGAKAFSRNKSLKKLNLFSNDVKAAGAVALSTNETLQTLGLMKNPIGPGKYNLLLADKQRKENYDKTKTALLSIMTTTKIYLPAIQDNHIFGRKEVKSMKDKFDYMQETNKQKQKSLLFQFANRSVAEKGSNKLTPELVKEVLSFMKPRPFRVII